MKKKWFVLLILWVGISCSFGEATEARKMDPPRGIYLLLPAGKMPAEEWLRQDFVEGISVRVRWQDVEKGPAEFDWSYLDRIFSMAHREHKRVFLRLLGGFWSPEWIYREGVPSFRMELEGRGPAAEAFFKKYGRSVRLPRVWHPTYLRYWIRFVEAVGNRYKEQPLLVLVHLSGPTFFSAEPIMARNQRELDFLHKQGFSEEKILEAWRITLQAFKASFPQQYLALNIHYIIKKEPRTVKRLWHLARETLGTRLALQGNWLGPVHRQWLHKRQALPDEDFFRLFVLARKEGVVMGFQHAASFTTMSRLKGVPPGKLFRVMRELLKMNLRLGIKYLEVYPEDLGNSSLQPLWEKFSRYFRSEI